MAGEQVIGVLHVGRLEDRPFTHADAELLQVVADRVAGPSRPPAGDGTGRATALSSAACCPAGCRRAPACEFAARYLTPERARRGRLVRRVHGPSRGPVGRHRRRGRSRPAGRGGHGPGPERLARLRPARRRPGGGVGADQPEGAALRDRAMVTVVCASASFPYHDSEWPAPGTRPPRRRTLPAGTVY